MIRRASLAMTCALWTALPHAALAQTALTLGGLAADPDAAVEITAESLSVDRATGTALFEGGVVVGQGDLRLAATRVEVAYDEATGEITSLQARGSVTFATATEAAEAARADYDLASGLLTLSGDVLLSQGPAAISADRMVVNLADGTAQMEGSVRTIFVPEGGQ